jgi:hypothetical protein
MLLLSGEENGNFGGFDKDDAYLTLMELCL